jgi:DNA relaxase NicK
MPIPKNKYIELKAMYDFQRKVEYNKEKLRKAVDFMLEEPDALFDDIWGKMKEEEMVDVPKDWVPKNDKLKISGEQ